MNITPSYAINFPSLPILDVVKELTVGQRASDSKEKLSSFLHTSIFKKLGPFSIEIYFRPSQLPQVEQALIMFQKNLSFQAVQLSLLPNLAFLCKFPQTVKQKYFEPLATVAIS